MTSPSSPLHLLILAVAGGLNQHRLRILGDLKEENLIFQEQRDGCGPDRPTPVPNLNARSVLRFESGIDPGAGHRARKPRKPRFSFPENADTWYPAFLAMTGAVIGRIEPQV